MKRVVIDTNVYSRAMAGHIDASKILRQAEELLICPIVAGELYAGFRKGSRRAENLELFRKFLMTPRVTVISITLDTSEFYSIVLDQLRKNGTPIPTNDIWIAALTMEYGARLATMDKHFTHISGLLTV